MEEKIERRGRPRKKKPNGNQIDMEMRLREILKKLGKGKGRKEIEEDLKRDYGVSDATIQKDFRRAFKHLKDNQEVFTKKHQGAYYRAL